MTKKTKISDKFTDFEKLKSELSSARIDVRIREKAIKEDPDLTRHPATREDFERKIKALLERISQLEVVVATEPPPPELPPRQPLFKVCGVLEEFSVQKVIGYFGSREYAPEAFAREEERNQMGSLLLAMTGNAAGSAVTGQSRVRLRDCCDFVRGKINGISFYGWLGKTHVRNGDYIEMAVMAHNDHYVVYAITLPELRTLSMTPRCRCGREADIRFATFYGVSVFTSIFFIILIIFFFKGLDWEGLMGIAAIFAVTMFLIFSVANIRARKTPEPAFRLAESIFSTLGLSDPQRVDLRVLTKKKLSALAFSDMPPVTDREMPSRRSAWVNYFYYY